MLAAIALRRLVGVGVGWTRAAHRSYSFPLWNTPPGTPGSSLVLAPNLSWLDGIGGRECRTAISDANSSFPPLILPDDIA